MDQYLDTFNDATSKVLDQYDALRAIWGDILQGFSYCVDENVYLKHLDDIDHSQIAKIQTNLTHKFLKMGVPTRAERLDFIINESQEWTQDDEDEITSAEYFISDNMETYETSVIPAQKQEIGKAIEEAKEIIHKKKIERETKIGVVAETKAEKMANNYHIYFAFYKDSELKQRMWSRDEFEDLEDYELTKWIIKYNQETNCFSNKNFKKIAAMPFTLNLASYCKDQGMFFFGKPITQFSTYQLGVFTKVMRNTFVLRETKNKAGSPEINNELKMKDLVDWYDIEYNVIIAENSASK